MIEKSFFTFGVVSAGFSSFGGAGCRGVSLACMPGGGPVVDFGAIPGGGVVFRPLLSVFCSACCSFCGSIKLV